MDDRFATLCRELDRCAKIAASYEVRSNGRRMAQLRRSLIKGLTNAGIPVAPLAPGTTVPLKGSHGFRDASCDVSWLADQPRANFVIPTGAASGLVALDIDLPDGFAQLAEACQQVPELRDLVSHGALVRSASGGAHVWLPADEHELPSGPLRKFNHIEIKGDRTGLTGPLTWRGGNGHKCPGVYLPTRINRGSSAGFLGIEASSVSAVEAFTTGLAPVRKLQTLEATPRVERHELRGEITNDEAERWLRKEVAHFCSLPDGHQRASNTLVWKALWLSSGGYLDANTALNYVRSQCPNVRMSNGKARTTPYPVSAIDAVVRSVAQRVNTMARDDPKAASSEVIAAVNTVIRSREQQIRPPVREKINARPPVVEPVGMT